MNNVYKMVTDRIIAEMEKGVIPWEKPWNADGRACAISWVTGKAYSLLNQMLLGGEGEWLTFNEIKRQGGRVKKGEKSSIIVFWKWLEKDVEKNGEKVIDSNGKVLKEKIPFLKYINVFEVAQCEGIERKTSVDATHPIGADEVAEKVINDYAVRAKLKLVHMPQNRAYYSPAQHKVVLPTREQFNTIGGYYETAFHEITHSTGHESLLKRFALATGIAAFGSEDYSREELVAEIGSACCMSRLGLETDKTIRNGAAYVQGWLKALRNDEKMIVVAAGKAQKAVELIFGDAQE